MEQARPRASPTRSLGVSGRRLRNATAATVAAIAINALCGGPAANAAAAAIQPFSEFVQGLSAASDEALTAKPEAAIESTAAASEMRQHLLKLYDGVTVGHSFATSDQVFDCVPRKQQPALRLQALTSIATPPPQSPAEALKAPSSSDLSQGKGASATVQGGTEQCETGTIPMRRITLEEMARTPNLQAFFAKGPDGAGHPQLGKPALPQTGKPTLSQYSHGYAHAYQCVKNYGGYGALNFVEPLCRHHLAL
jgi:hypothetical protein